MDMPYCSDIRISEPSGRRKHTFAICVGRSREYAAFNLETGEMHEHLERMGFKDVVERVFGVVE